MRAKALTLVASDVAPVGGMERATLELATRLLDRGWELTVIARSCSLPPSPGLRFIRIRAPSRPVSVALAMSWVHGSLLVLRHRAGILQTTNPVLANRVDVVHAQFSERAYRHRVGIPRSRRPTPAYRLNSWISAQLELLAEQWAYRPGRIRCVVCASEGLAREIAEFFPAVAPAVRAIPNGVDTSAFAPSRAARDEYRARLGLDGELLAIFVGGDWRRKGLRHAIEGVAAAPGWHLAVLGSGDVEPFAELANRLHARAGVHFLGNDRPHGWYAAADAMVQPSSYEAFSLAMLEGAAAGLPLLVPRINGTEELVEDGVTGWFTERHGSAIAVRLRELAADPALHAGMREASLKAARRYDWARIVDRFEALYGELSGAGVA